MSQDHIPDPGVEFVQLCFFEVGDLFICKRVLKIIQHLDLTEPLFVRRSYLFILQQGADDQVELSPVWLHVLGIIG